MTKLTIIGAGSAVFTKNIVTDLLSLDSFKKMEIALQDIDPLRLKASHELLNVISEKLNASPKITSHTDRRESLVGSDFVQTTIQVGGYKPSTVIDFEIPRKFGLSPPVRACVAPHIHQTASPPSRRRQPGGGARAEPPRPP